MVLQIFIDKRSGCGKYLRKSQQEWSCIIFSQGLEHLHSSGLQSHGRMKSSNCLVDARWVLKITDYGLSALRSGQSLSTKGASIFHLLFAKRQKRHVCLITDKLWMAPELLRTSHPPPQGTQKGDVYSFAIVLSEIISRDKPYGMFEDMTPEGKRLHYD